MPPGRHHPRRRRRRRAGPHRRFCGRAWNRWPRRPSRPLRCATRQACAVWVRCCRAMPTRRSVSPTTSPKRPTPTPMTWRSMNPSPNHIRPCHAGAGGHANTQRYHQSTDPACMRSSSSLRRTHQMRPCRRARKRSVADIESPPRDIPARICQRVAELVRAFDEYIAPYWRASGDYAAQRTGGLRVRKMASAVPLVEVPPTFNATHESAQPLETQFASRPRPDQHRR